MERQSGRILFALILIAMGVLALLNNFNMLPFSIDNNQIFWTLAFGGVGLAFIAVFVTGIRQNWWAIIPGLTLLALGLLIGFPAFWNELGGSMFLGMIGLSFWLVFLTAPVERWWAIIPGGVLLTLTGVTLISTTRMDDMVGGGIFFLGLGLTFALVYLLARMRWALWPAGVLGFMGALLMAGAGNMASLVLPILLVGAGGILILRALRPRAQ